MLEAIRPPVRFAAAWCGLAGALVGLLTAYGDTALMLPYALAGALLFALLSLPAAIHPESPRVARSFCMLALALVGLATHGVAFALLMLALGWVLASASAWLATGRYRKGLPEYAGPREVLLFYMFRGVCALIFVFLVVPIFVVVPLSFNQEPYFSFTAGMLNLEADAFSLRWYADIVRNGMVAPDAEIGWWADMWNNAQWVRSIKNSFIIGIPATLLATALGTMAAVGLSRSEMPFKRTVMALLISPMVVPLVITASGLFFAFSQIGLAKTYPGLIFAHAVLGVPFVVITVTASLAGFDHNLVRASTSLGASPVRTFFKIQTPIILPGVVSGALFAFITSFDEVVVILQLGDVTQRTVPRQMFSGIREQISPTILAVATIFVLISILLLATVALLRRRAERLHGVPAH